MGILGKSLGKNQPWSEGQASLLSLWGSVGPIVATSTSLSFSENTRVIGSSILLGGAAGYLAGNYFNRNDFYTRGDVRSIGALSVLNGFLGAGILADILADDVLEPGNWVFLFPAAGVLSGTLAGQAWMKNTDLTPRQGMNSIWMMSGGAVLGLGLALMVNSDKITPWYAIPYVTSLGAYAYSVESSRKKNAAMGTAINSGWNRWSISLMPQNLFLNEKISGSEYRVNGTRVLMQPVFSAALTF